MPTSPPSLTTQIKRLGRRILTDARLLPVVPQQAFASHFPILITLAHLFPVRRVIEFGSGTFSTPLFLNRTAFPNLDTILSYEHSTEWLAKVQAATGPDPRLSLVVTESAAMLAETVATATDAVDLIFVDNGDRVEERAATIAGLARQAPRRAVVVVHDFQQAAYRQAAGGFGHVVRSKAYFPNTGVMWNDAPIAAGTSAATKLIWDNALRLQPDDVPAWVRLAGALSHG